MNLNFQKKEEEEIKKPQPISLLSNRKKQQSTMKMPNTQLPPPQPLQLGPSGVHTKI
jgi:hypothetical protein